VRNSRRSGGMTAERLDTAVVYPHIDNLPVWVHIVDGNINLFPDLFVVNRVALEGGTAIDPVHLFRAATGSLG
jgi:hypothetical protein